jgi:hypothetical protein
MFFQVELKGILGRFEKDREVSSGNFGEKAMSFETRTSEEANIVE